MQAVRLRTFVHLLCCYHNIINVLNCSIYLHIYLYCNLCHFRTFVLGYLNPEAFDWGFNSLATTLSCPSISTRINTSPTLHDVITCLESCSSHSLYRVKNFRLSTWLSRKPALASLTLMMMARSGTIMATVLNWIFRFSGSSWRPA